MAASSSSANLPTRAEIAAIVTAIIAKIRETDQEAMICDQVAAKLQEWLIQKGIPHKPWLYSTYDPTSPSAMQVGEIWFNGVQIGHDSHLFTEVQTTDGWLAFDNVSTQGIALAVLNAGLSFYWAHGPDNPEISISMSAVHQLVVPAATVRANSLRTTVRDALKPAKKPAAKGGGDSKFSAWLKNKHKGQNE